MRTDPRPACAAEHHEAILAVQGIKVVVAAMQRHEGEGVQEAGCLTLRHLAAGTTGGDATVVMNALLLLRANGIRATWRMWACVCGDNRNQGGCCGRWRD